MQQNKAFYGYKHWTLEEVPRCFYVGKGIATRPYSKLRNHKWHAVVKRYGLRVEVCVGPISHDEVLAWELDWVAREGTFSTNHSHGDPSNIGCNFTCGGHGSVGYHLTPAQREKQSLALKGRKFTPEHLASFRTSRMRPEVRQRYSAGAVESQRKRFADPDERLKQSTRIKAAWARYDVRVDQPQRCGLCGTLGHNRRTCKERQR